MATRKRPNASPSAKLKALLREPQRELRPEPIVVNDAGGAQSAVEYRFDLIPADAILRTSEIFAMGANRYARNNWARIPMSDHLNHLMGHIALYMSGDRTEDHLAHAACRVLMAMATQDDDYDFSAYEPLGSRK